MPNKNGEEPQSGGLPSAWTMASSSVGVLAIWALLRRQHLRSNPHRPFHDHDLSGRTVIVTGSSGGEW